NAVRRRSRSGPRPSRLPRYARVWGRGMADAVISAMRVYRERSRAGASDLLRDVHVAVRSWTHERSFTLTVLATLVVCLGGNTVIFSIVRSVLLKPLPIAGAERIVLVSDLYPKFGFAAAGPGVGAASVPDYFDRRRDVRSFD